MVYQRILVPVDGSATSMLGLNEAVVLAADQHAQLCILNVIDELILVPTADGFPMTGADEVIATLRTEGRKALERGAALAAKGKVPVDCVQVESRGNLVSEVILKQVRKWRADLVVMGTHGRRGFNRLLMGSDAERVLREAPVPVLLVRGDKVKRDLPKTLRISTVPAGRSSEARAKRKQPA